MFLRRYRKQKNGKTHVYWALVESHRTVKGSRQRVVSYLGELTESERSGWAQLSSRLGKNKSEENAYHRSLFDPPPSRDEGDGEFGSSPVLVDIKGVRLENLRDFGDIWLACGLWRLLGLDQLLASVMDKGREMVPWPMVAAILAIARFCEPSSELHIETTWYGRSALEDLLGVSPDQVHTDRLYVGLDKLLPHKEAIEKHLKHRLGQLFELDYELLLYDVTSTYFEGQCQQNSLAKRGHSRDKRPDCLQVCIGLIVTTDGIPVGYEVFAGNRHDSKTVEHIVESIEKKHGAANRIWVMDRGMVSESNLEFVRSRNGHYIVGTPKASLRRFEQQLLEQTWEQVEQGVEVKLVPSPDGGETFILARSAERREKEKAIHERFLQRVEAGLLKIKTAMQEGRLRDEGQAERRVGRLMGENSRAAKAFDVVVERIPLEEQSKLTAERQPTEANGDDGSWAKSKSHPQPTLRIRWERNDKWREWASLSEGCYLLRSNLKETDPKKLWKQYIQLTDAEWAFRVTKDELTLRPIWHHKEDRVKAHILVCFIAYAMWKTLGGWMKRSGLGDAPRTVLNELTKIKSADIVLPIASPNEAVTQQLILRCVTEPDPVQKLMLHRLGLDLPKRLGSRLQNPEV